MAKALTDQQKIEVLKRLYDAQPHPVDRLPYTDEITKMHVSYVAETDSVMNILEFYQLCLWGRRRGHLGRKTERRIKNKTIPARDKVKPPRQGGLIDFGEKQ